MAPSDPPPDTRVDDTLPAAETPLPGAPDRAPLLGDLDADRRGRYQLGALIGRGGMGEVFVARDLDIERNVALKRTRTAEPSSEAVARFLREARVQGRLEHPAIVPVHDLGTDADGRPFFTMKRVAGTTLLALLPGARDDAAAQRRLLRAFVEVSLAVEFAHVSGVVHRDLKPANVVLGDFGEVYVLDWGVARIVGDDELPPDPDSGSVDSGAVTQPGAVLGTPAYMAPEQRSGADGVGPAADVYSLGCILFEILAGEPLHLRHGDRPQPLVPAQAQPSSRGVDVAPELEAACVAATDPAASARPSARELAERVQRYLDGDRDAVRRRELADDHVAAAMRALADARPDDADARASAMRDAGRALALDPTSAAAAQLVSRLVLEPPREVPAEVERILAARDIETIARQGVIATRTIGAFAIAFAVFMWIFVDDWRLAVAAFVVPATSAVHAAITTRQRRAFRRADVVYVLLSNAVILALLSRLFGSYLLVPAVATAAMSGLVVLPPLLGAYNEVFLVFAAAIAVPAGLEAAGAWRRVTVFDDHGITVTPLGAHFHAGAEPAILAAVLALLYAGGRYVRDLAVANREANRKLELQAWHLRQLIPPSG